MPHTTVRNGLISRISGLILTTLTHVSHPRGRGNCNVPALERHTCATYRYVRYTRRVFASVRFSASVSRRGATRAPPGYRRETLRVETRRGYRQSPSKRISHRGLKTKHSTILFARMDIYCIEKRPYIYIRIRAASRITRECKFQREYLSAKHLKPNYYKRSKYGWGNKLKRDKTFRDGARFISPGFYYLFI